MTAHASEPPSGYSPGSGAGQGAGYGAEGTVVGEYTLLAKIGEGGMGIVHLARRADGGRVALKMLRPHIVGDDEARARLAREVGSLERIRSPWVAEILDADPWAPVPFVATRYVPGLPLHDHVVEEGPITGVDLLWFATGLAEGLASVHAVGVLHRDVKPSNVLMEGRRPILIDFGLARLADDPRLTHTGWLLGTPGYLAPEILYGDDATPASDVHSWAATVAYAATGGPPFGRGPSMAIIDRVRRGEHDLTGVPEPVRAVVAAALDPEPARRPSLAAIRERLRDEVSAGTVPAPAPPGEEPEEDMFTLPLALAAAGALGAPTAPVADTPTAVETTFDAPPRTQVLPTEVVPAEPPRLPPPPAYRAPPVAYRPVTAPDLPPAAQPGERAWEQQWDQQQWDQQPWGEPAAPVRQPLAVRARAAALVGAGAVVVGAAVAVAPWAALALLALVVWLLRSGSLAASAVGDKRRLRGRRWYDSAQLVVKTPWHLLQSLPGTIGLLLWSGGLALAAALLCYAVATGIGVTLFVCGLVLALATWWGPGGSRVRNPLSRVVDPIAAGVGGWVAGLVILAGMAVGLGLLVSSQGVSWAPASDRPFSSYELPGAGLLP